MKKLNILFIPDFMRWKISKKWSTVVILLLAVLCMAAHNVENLSSFLFVAIAVSAPLAVTSILWNALHLCLLNNVHHRHCVFTIDENLRDFSFNTELCLIVFFILLPTLFHICSLKSINPWTSLQDISWFSILLEEISNGILTFTVWFPKVATAIMGVGTISRILIIHTSEMLSVPLYLMKWKAGLTPLSRKSKPYVI